MRGNCAAQMTAKMVIASAERLIEVRHCWRKRSRTAEINVPACQIPTKKTKLGMSKDQPTLLFNPQRPMPLMKVRHTARPKSIRTAKAKAKQAHHPFPGRATRGHAISSDI